MSLSRSFLSVRFQKCRPSLSSPPPSPFQRPPWHWIPTETLSCQMIWLRWHPGAGCRSDQSDAPCPNLLLPCKISRRQGSEWIWIRHKMKKQQCFVIRHLCSFSVALKCIFFFENASYPVWVLIDARNVIKLELSLRRPLNWKFPVLQLLRLPTVWLIEIVQMFCICLSVRPQVLTMC